MSRLRDLLRAADTTAPPPSNVRPIHDWAAIEGAIHKTRSYLTMAEAEKHKCELALEEADAMVEEARAMVAEAENTLTETVKNILGVRFERFEKKEVDTK